MKLWQREGFRRKRCFFFFFFLPDLQSEQSAGSQWCSQHFLDWHHGKVWQPDLQKRRKDTKSDKLCPYVTTSNLPSWSTFSGHTGTLISKYFDNWIIVWAIIKQNCLIFADSILSIVINWMLVRQNKTFETLTLGCLVTFSKQSNN